MSFAQLDEASSRVANALTATGVGTGDRVAVLSKNTPEFFELAFACAKIGAIVVGLNWRLAPPEISAIVTDARPSVMFVSAPERTLFDPAAVPFELRTIELGTEYDAWKAGGSPLDPGGVGLPDDVCLLLYTSGTTGLPKGVMLTHRGVSFTARSAREIWDMDAASVNIVAMPLFHIGGVGYSLSNMSQGGHTVLMREVDTAAIIRAIEEHRVTHAFFVPSVIQLLLATPGVDGADLTSLELLVYGASPIGDAVLRQAIDVFGCQFMHLYGMTEATGSVVGLPPEDHHPDGERSYLLRSCGKPLPWVELRVIDPDRLDDVEGTAVGEIWVRSEAVTPGYWGKPNETAAAIVGDGWLRTGDAAYRDADGYVYLFDRFKDMIVSGAENVYPAEVENVLADHPAVAEVAVIGVPHERWGETVKAIVVLRPDHVVEPSELIAFARTRLGRFKCPTSIDFTEVLPRNASGKLLKKELRVAYWPADGRAIN